MRQFDKTLAGMLAAVGLAVAISMTGCGQAAQTQTEEPAAQEEAAKTEEQTSAKQEQSQEQTTTQQTTTQEQVKLSADEAKSIALTDAGVAEADVTELSVELDHDDDTGITQYEVSFKVGTTEHDYDIDPNTGAILLHETEVDN